MKKIIVIFLFVFLSLSLQGNDSFNKVMAKNRASKNIGSSSYKVINGKKQFYKAQRKGRTIGTKVNSKGNKNAYVYLEVKNVKLKKQKEKRKYGLEKTKNKKQKKFYGVKVNKKFKGKLYNTVKVKNSRLN